MACTCVPKYWLWKVADRTIYGEFDTSAEATAYWTDDLEEAEGFFISTLNEPILAFLEYTELEPEA